MKRFALILALVVMVVGCKNTPKEPERTPEEIRYTDSLLQFRAFRDSMISAGVIERYAPNFNVKTDEFTTDTTYEHKVFPITRKGKYLSLLIKKDGKKDYLLLEIYYSDRDWLFMDRALFKIDGEVIEIPLEYRKLIREVVYGGIYELYMDGVWGNDRGDELCERFIKKLVYAKEVKVRLSGKGYYDMTISQKDLEALKEIYEYYVALSGRFASTTRHFKYVGEDISHSIDPEDIVLGNGPTTHTIEEHINDANKALEELEKSL